MAFTLASLPYYLGRGGRRHPPEEFYPKARDAARTAIELDDTLATAHKALGHIEFSYYWDWAVAEREFQRAIELKPGSAEAHLWYGVYLAWIGRSEDGIAEGRRAVELDPLSLRTNTRLGMILYFARRYDEAIEQLKKVLDMEPNFGDAHLWLFYTYMKKGLYEDAFATFQKYWALGDFTMPITYYPWYAYLHAQWGKTDEARRALSAPGWTNVAPWTRACVYGALGEKDEAFLLLEQAYEERSPLLAVAKEDPRLDSLRDDPRFQDLLRRMNFPK
jgi:tetratricopeptide (TPR) repeat protein